MFLIGRRDVRPSFRSARTAPLIVLLALPMMVTAAAGQDQLGSSPPIYHEHFTTSPAVRSTGGAILPAANQLPGQPLADYSNGLPQQSSGNNVTSGGHTVPLSGFPEPRGPAIEPPPGYGVEQPRTFDVAQLDDVFTDGAGLSPGAVDFLKGRALATWLPAGSDELGMTELDIRSGMTFSRLPMLTITPGFQLDIFDGPTRTDLPGQAYAGLVEFSLARPPSMTTPWGYELAAAPGYYSDFENTSSDAIRITGRGVLYLAQSVALQWVLGVTYLDREDIDFLPIAGFIYSPHDDLRLELVFPKPRIAQRIRQMPGSEQWVYLAGEFGGGEWAIERSNGREDIATIRDLRISLGLETKHAHDGSLFVEVGLVFDRELEYKSGIGDFDPDATAMLRMGMVF